MLPLLASLGRMAISSKVGKKVATESAKKSGKKVAEKVFDKTKKDSVEKVEGGKGSAIVKVPKVSTKIISADALFGDRKKVESDKKDAAKITESFFDDILDVLKSIKISLSKIQETLNERKAISFEQEVQDRKETSKRKSRKRESKLEGKDKKGSLSKINFKTSGIPFIDRIMNFFGMVLIGSLVLFLYKKINEIIKFFEDTFLKIKEFFKAIEPFVKPIWDGMQWIVGKGTEFIGKMLGIPPENLSDKEILKNINEIKDKIPVLKNLFDGINSTIESLRSGRGLTPTQTGSPGPSSYAAGSIPQAVSQDVQFTQGVTKLAQKYNVPEDYLYAVMGFETGGTFDPAKKNIAGSGATGLIQFMPSTAEGLGTTTTALAKMSRAEQLKYVDKYFASKNIQGGSLSDLYMAVLLPAAVGKPEDFVLFGTGGAYGGQRAYQQNKGLDLNNDGKITKAEATSKVAAYLPKGFTPSLTQQKQRQADATAQQAAAEASVPTAAPGTLAAPTPQPTSLEPTATQAQVSPTQAPPVLSQSVPQIMQQAEYEVTGTQNNIVMIASGKSGNNLMTSGSRSMILSVSKKEALNSYYQSQLIGFLYKQG